MSDVAGGLQIKEARSPVSRISKPEFVDWHMILDNELSQLSRPQTGIIGSVGFTALGAALGLLPVFVESWKKVSGAPPEALSTVEFVSAIVCGFSAAGAIICLVIFAISGWRNAGLADRIRQRPKHQQA